ncbi:hypothetical protein R1sor_002240 [Riccia sorocarpa]|uniref:Uncharacterized protein n=1 Tax=Riccia sorocarpa TaxID=122646 RepID=A0ABD3GZ20_9MARC
MMGDDDEWKFSPEELDALEKTAATQLAAHKHVPPSAPPASTWDSPSKHQFVHSLQPRLISSVMSVEVKHGRITTNVSQLAGGQHLMEELLVEALKTVPAGRLMDGSLESSRLLTHLLAQGLDLSGSRS